MTLALSEDEISALRQLLGQFAPTPDGNLMKLREKLYGPLDGTPVELSGEEIQFLHAMLNGIEAIDAEGNPEPRHDWVERLIEKLAGALGDKRRGVKRRRR